ncbi:lysophosphatidylcholine acyltransferase 1 isoform 1 [Camelus ferus]|nr:lysophosphatidylcholine acyltransferase 1 isoform 1 [Camelus ferus]
MLPPSWATQVPRALLVLMRRTLSMEILHHVVHEGAGALPGIRSPFLWAPEQVRPVTQQGLPPTALRLRARWAVTHFGPLWAPDTPRTSDSEAKPRPQHLTHSIPLHLHLTREAVATPRWPSSALKVPAARFKVSIVGRVSEQVTIMTLTLFPIRLLFAACMMLLAWPLALVASLGSAEREPEQPLASWRKVPAVSKLRVVDVLLRAIMRTMWFAGGFHRVAVKGQQALPSEAAILTLAPHSSYFDAIPVTMTMSSIVMKAESRDIPIWGTLIKYIRPVFVSRSDQDSRRKTVEEIKRRAQSGGKWPQSRVRIVSAFIPGVPVQPVVLRYPNRLFLPVYSPSEEERKDPALYASNVRRVMAEALGVSVTDYTFEDCQLALAEGQLRLPEDTCLLEFARLVRGLGLKPEKLDRALDRHAERAGAKPGGRVTLPEFAAQLGVPVSEALEDLFSLFDEGGGGEIDLREYVVALSVVCRPSQTLDTVRLAFQASAALTDRLPPAELGKHLGAPRNAACSACVDALPGMYGSQDGSIDQGALSCILRTALGVAELSVAELFRAIDQEETGKITFADFERFAETYPDFAEEYLYPDQTRFQSGTQTPPALTANGFCTDFSPENSGIGPDPLCKKLD